MLYIYKAAPVAAPYTLGERLAAGSAPASSPPLSASSHLKGDLKRLPKAQQVDASFGGGCHHMRLKLVDGSLKRR